MKGPICIEDAKTNRLCLICEAKLKAGMISENDVRIWKELVRMSETNFLLGLEFLRSFEVNHSLNIVCKGTIGPLIGRGGKNIKELEQKLGKKIHIIEKTADALKSALEMSIEEQQQRMKQMRQVIVGHNIYSWAATLLRTMATIQN